MSGASTPKTATPACSTAGAAKGGRESKSVGETSDKPYAHFRFGPFVDWVELRLTLLNPTQVRYLRAALPPAWASCGEVPYADPAAGASSHTDTVFTIRVQDPKSAHSISRDLRRLQEQFLFAEPPRITGVEVGIDAYARNEHASLVEMAETFHRCHAAPPSDNRRIPGLKGTVGMVESALESRRMNRAALEAGRTLFTGNQSDPLTHRVYIKDGNRARFEVTLIGDAVPFRTLEEWGNFKFEKLSGYFRWRRQPASDHSFGRMLQNAQVALAKRHGAKAERNHRRIHKKTTGADHDLRDEADKALRRLTTVQKRGWPTKSNSQSSRGQAAGISTILPTQVVDLKWNSPSLLSTTQLNFSLQTTTPTPPAAAAQPNTTLTLNPKCCPCTLPPDNNQAVTVTQAQPAAAIPSSAAHLTQGDGHEIDPIDVLIRFLDEYLLSEPHPLPSPLLDSVRHPELIGSTRSGHTSSHDCLVAQHAPLGDPQQATEAGLIALGELGLSCALPSATAHPCSRHAGQFVVPLGHAATLSVVGLPVARGDDQWQPCNLNSMREKVSQS